MKISFLLNNLGLNQIAFQAINEANKITKARNDVDVILYYESLVRPCMAHGFMISNIFDAYSNDGIVVATSLSNASKLLSFPNPKRKVFYVTDLEWISLPEKTYDGLARVYQSKQFELVARSESHRQIIERAWNVPARVVENFNVEGFLL